MHKLANRLTFDEQEHIYKVDGNQKASVTQILGEYIRFELDGETYYIQSHTGTIIRGYIMERAGFIGTNFHLACKYYLEGLSWDSLDITFRGEDLTLRDMMDQFIKWYKLTQPKILLIEKPLYSPKYDYCGTPDIFYETTCNSNGGRYFTPELKLLDIKTGMFDMAPPQLSAYEQLIRENLGIKKPIEKEVLHIPKSGDSYRVVPIKGDHFDYFKSKLYEKNYMRRLTI